MRSAAAGRRCDAARVSGDRLLLCDLGQVLGDRPAGRRVGDVPYARRDPDVLDPLQERTGGGVLHAEGDRCSDASVVEEAGCGVMLRGDVQRVEPACPGDRPAILSLLQGAQLPTSDLGAATPVHLCVLRDDGRVDGVIGLERFGDASPLRSPVVDPAGRGARRGRRLVECLERGARAEGLRSLTLLTETAEAFFAHLGYARLARAAGPAPVQSSAEFAALCPASATTMQKILH